MAAAEESNPDAMLPTVLYDFTFSISYLFNFMFGPACIYFTYYCSTSRISKSTQLNSTQLLTTTWKNPIFNFGLFVCFLVQ